MKKLLLLFGLVFFCCQLNAQILLDCRIESSNQLKLSINNNTGIQSIQDSSLAFLDESKPGSPRLMTKTFYVAIPPNSKISAKYSKKNFINIKEYSPLINPKVSLKNDTILVYEKAEPAREYFTADTYPVKDIEIIDYTWIRNYYVAIVKVNLQDYNWKKRETNIISDAEISIEITNQKPFVKNTSKDEYDRLLSSLIINYEQAKDFKSFPDFMLNDTSDDWIDFSKEYIKLKIPIDGIYRITYSDLTGYGVNIPSINPKTIKLFNKGKEIPVYVNGEDDFVFNENDYIEFWSEKNYNTADYTQVVPQGKDYINYYDRYTDTTFIWITWDGSEGKRIPFENSVLSSNEKLNYHKEKIHLEKDERLWYYDADVPRTQLPFWQEHKVFTWKSISHSGTFSVNFNARSILPNSEVKTILRLISNGASTQIPNVHKIGVSLNASTPQDTISYNYKQTVNFISDFSSSFLKAGSNTFKVYGIPTDASFHQSLIDWVDIEYSCSNNAVNDSLYVIIPENLEQNIRTVEINNITSLKENLLVYKIKPNLKQYLNFQISGGKLSFTDTVKSSDVFLVIKKNSTLKPGFISKKYFPNLRSNDGSDYIIISNKLLKSSTERYADFIAEKYNLRTDLFFVDEIYDEFSYGYLNAEAIKTFLLTAYNNWTTPKPSYLLIVGDGNYDYKDIWTPVPAERKKNLVPSYGNPVSDVWYVTFDSASVNIPQMCVGRIPANNNQEVENYLSKHNKYLQRENDSWNKNFLFFSGGDTRKPSELQQIKNVNDNIFNNLVKSFPLGGTGKHFYKTSNPSTNFGPYTQQEVRDAIDSGGVFISYIGHSGTQTWDNGITTVPDLKNIFADRFPLISDFGCSTGKFAEPDVNAFGELFVSGSPDGQAINYLGNSSLGFLSTSLNFPIYFYNSIIKERLPSVGICHLQAKLKQFNETGFSDVNRVFNYCNLLFGDPIISLSIPDMPNFVIEQQKISLVESEPNDQLDFVNINLTVFNKGIGVNDSLAVYISDTFQESVVFEKVIKIYSLLNGKQLTLKIPIKDKSGTHKISVILDSENLIAEYDETDNTSELSFDVYPANLRYIGTEKYYAGNTKIINLLNPIKSSIGKTENLIFECSDNPAFQVPLISINKRFDTLISRIPIRIDPTYDRFWWRVKIDDPSISWSEPYSFTQVDEEFNWYFGESFKSEDVTSHYTFFDSLSKSWKLTDAVNNLKIISAGSSDGKYASLELNAQEKLPNTFFWGIATAEIDTVTFVPKNIKYFENPSSQSADSLIKYINRLPQGTILAMTICDDGAQSVLGYNGGTPVRKAIKTLGSYYADSIRYRESWCMLGKKGAPIGSVPEVYRKQFKGAAVINISKITKQTTGDILFPLVKNAGNWKNIIVEKNIPDGSKLELIPIVSNSSKTDTLAPLSFNSDTASLSHINSGYYSNLRLLAKLSANTKFETPEIKSIGINYAMLPELCTNYQTVSVTRDSLILGDSLKLKFSVHNVGETMAENLRLRVEVIKPDNSIRLMMDSVIANLDSMQYKEFDITYRTNIYDGSGEMKFKIFIDEENKIAELYEDNNSFEIPFKVKPDTTQTSVTSATVAVAFDGIQINDGDYVSSNPQITFSLDYPVWFPVYDSTAVEFFIDNQKISASQLDIFSDTINRRAIYKYKTFLADGEHSLDVFGQNIIGEIDNTPGFSVKFNVSSQMKLMDVFNYPNPFSSNTNFTFVLTQVPDELKIKIFTVAGRQIREMDILNHDLRAGFNMVPWDGRDQDGSIIANGVYFYKIIVIKDGKSENQIQKLAIVR